MKTAGRMLFDYAYLCFSYKNRNGMLQILTGKLGQQLLIIFVD